MANGESTASPGGDSSCPEAGSGSHVLDISIVPGAGGNLHLLEMQCPKPDGFELPVTTRSGRCSKKRAEGISPASFLLRGIVAELLSQEAAWVGGGGREAGFGPQGPCPPTPGSWKPIATAGIHHSGLILSSQEESGVNHGI